MKYFDIHAHVFPENIAAKAVAFLEDYYRFRWEGTGVIGNLSDALHRANIDRCLVFASATKPEQTRHVNDFICQTVASDPEHLVGFCTLHPGYADWKNELKRAASLGLLGIKLHPDFQHFDLDAPEMMPIYAEAQAMGMPVLAHVGDKNSDASSPKRAAKIADRFPTLKFIASHLGGYSKWDEARHCLAGRENVWFDTSSTRPFLPIDEMRDLIRLHGVKRVLFGSDYPAKLPGNAAQDVRDLGLNEDEYEMIFYRNACDLLGIKE